MPQPRDPWPVRVLMAIAAMSIAATIVGAIYAEVRCFQMMDSGKMTFAECRELDLRSLVVETFALIVLLVQLVRGGNGGGGNGGGGGGDGV